MSHLAIFTLGPLRVELDGKPLQTSRHKALALIIYLAMQPQKHTREALSALFWPDYEQEKAFAYLRRTLWEIRTLLGETWIDANRTEIGYSHEVKISLDMAEFQAHVAAFRQHNHPGSVPCAECIAHLHTVALLYRGDFLAEFTLRDSPNFEDWQFFQREAIRRDYADALNKLSNSLYDMRAFNDASAFSQRWLALDSLNEEAHRLLMKIYAATGHRHLAVRQYHLCGQALQTELGVNPEPATSYLYEEIVSGHFEFNRAQSTARSRPVFAEDGDLESGQPVKVVRETTPFTNLPVPPTPFVGRQRSIEHLSSFLSAPNCWLLTLLGPGGVGKTRLAIETGRKLMNSFPHGVYFNSLSMIEKERSLTPAIARSVGLTFRQNGPPPDEQLFDFLREKKLLLILDTFEHLIQSAGLLGKIHSHAPGVKMLVTSRHRLQLYGEKVIEVEGLEYPRTIQEVENAIQPGVIQAFSAIELFVQTVVRSQAFFQPSPAEVIAIARITQMLQGNPLGLELAASWINVLTCEEIANEISRGLDILETSVEDISERQRSMRAVFDHSWNLLSLREQTLLPRLTVFRGSFSRQAAEQVAGISHRELSGLVDKSLVKRTSNGRFYLHDLMRQYCAEILDKLPLKGQETGNRHCVYYSNRFAEWNELLQTAKQSYALQKIEADLENIEAAREWSVGHKLVACLKQFVDGLGVFYLRRARLIEGLDAYREAGEILQGYLSSDDDLQLARVTTRILTWQAVLSLNLEHFAEAKRLIQAGQTILDRQKMDQQDAIPERIFGWIAQTVLSNLQFDAAAALYYYRKAKLASLAADLKSPRMYIFLWRFMMSGSVSRELYLEIENDLEYVKQSGDPFESACLLYTLGIAELYHTYRPEKAGPLLRESILNFEQIGDPSTRIMVFKTHGYLLLSHGKFDECLAVKQQELTLVQEIGDLRQIGLVLAEIGEVLCHLGKFSEAEDDIRQGMALLKDRSAMEYALRHRYLGDTLLAQGKYEEARQAYLFSYRFFQSVDEKGWCMTSLTGLSRVEFSLGNREIAWQYARQALHLYREIQLYTFFVYLTLADIALYLVDQGEVIQGLEFYQLVSQQDYLARSRWFANLYGAVMVDAYTRLSKEEQDLLKQNRGTLDISELVEKVTSQ